ncbi:MAG: hypothetical protein MUE71_06545 [Chitinophagaceae bacterium]|nr:hypothetical protein [Chitinophagaceae bacterium]
MMRIQAAFEKEKNMKAAGYTFLILSVIVFLLLFISWKAPLRDEALLDEGIEVNLGNSDFGLGDIPPMVPGDPAPEAGEPIASAPQSSPPPPEPVTSEDDNDEPDAVTVPRKPAETSAKPKPVTNQTVSTTKPKPQPPAPAPPKPKATMGSYSGGQGTGGNSQDAFNNVRNQGVAGGQGDQGKANGNINSDNYKGNGGTGNSGVAITKGLSGRRIVTFPSFEDDFNENAKIAMNLRVDENGKVISAEYTASGSTSSNGKLKDIARRKAMQLKFNPGDGESLGTVVFNFRLKG